MTMKDLVNIKERAQHSIGANAEETIAIVDMLIDALHQFDPTRQIALVWDIEDVQEIRPELSDEQAMKVLKYVEKQSDSEYGVTWEYIESCSYDLFPE